MTETILRKEFIMKRTLSIILCLVMVLSLVAVSAYAAPKADEVGKVASGYTPEGTGIDSLDKITDPAGKYYLTKDITVSATFTTEFTGTFDGNGKKITTSVALFEKVNNATVKNFVVEGSVSLTAAGVTAGGSEDFYAAVAIIANGKSTFQNILSDVDITTTSSNTRIAAIAATSEADYDLVIDTCVNKGDISVLKYAGGVYGWTAKKGTGVVKNCANYGKITSTGGYIGGVINRMCGTDGALTVTDCANYGEVSSTGGAAAGILAYHDKSDLTITGCVNEGKINGAGGAAAGIVANPALGDAGKALTIKNCVNKGEVLAKNQMGGIVGYSNIKVGTIVIEDCVNDGPITAIGTDAYGSGIIGRAGQDDAGKNETSITIKNCVNNGAIKTGKDQVGGMMGYDCMKISTYEGCVNNGNIGLIEGAKDAHAGGFLGNHRAGTDVVTTFKNCVNNGDVVAQGSKSAGGIVANSNHHAIIIGCANYGDITSPAYNAGGLAGYLNGNNAPATVENNINAGKVTGGNAVSQLVAYINSNASVIKNNLAVGSAATSADTAKVVILMGSSADLSANTVEGNYYVENDGTTYYTYTATESNAANIVEFAKRKENSVIVVSAAQLASGEVAYKLNDAIGKEVFKQTLGTDKTPAFEGKSVIKNADGTYANPSTTPDTPKPSVPTGDMTVVIFAIMVLTVGSAVVIGKKVSVR